MGLDNIILNNVYPAFLVMCGRPVPIRFYPGRDRQRGGHWSAKGSKRLGQRLQERTVAIIEDHEPQLHPTGVLEEITLILRVAWSVYKAVR
jgi:hypothetical protein